MSATQTSSTRFTGQVKWFNTTTGYGFITTLDGEHKGKDIFVHYSSIRVSNNQYLYLVMGEYVEFNVERPNVKDTPSEREFHAVDVAGIKGGMLMCEVRHSHSEEREKRPSDTKQSSKPAKEPRVEKTTEPSTEGEYKSARKRPPSKTTRPPVKKV